MASSCTCSMATSSQAPTRAARRATASTRRSVQSVAPSSRRGCTHACTWHVHAHAMHAHALETCHTCTHAHMHTCTHARMHTCTHAHMHTYMGTCTCMQRVPPPSSRGCKHVHVPCMCPHRPVEAASALPSPTSLRHQRRWSLGWRRHPSLERAHQVHVRRGRDLVERAGGLRRVCGLV